MNYYLVILALLIGAIGWYWMERYLFHRYVSGNRNSVEENVFFKREISKSFLKTRSAVGNLFVFLFLTGVGSILFSLYGFVLLKMVRYLVIMLSVYLIAIIDHREMIVPNRILSVLLGIRGGILIMECIQNRNSEYLKEIVISPFLGFILGGGIFFLCWLLTKKGIGAGDVKLFAVIGAYTGSGVLFPIMFLSALLSAVYGIIMLGFHKLKWKDSIPFGPFVAAGTMIALLMGF